MSSTSLPVSFNSSLSLQPLVQVLRQMITEDKPGAKKLYGPFISTVEANPQLLSAFTDPEELRKHQEIIEMLLATIFPPSNFEAESLYAISYPFRSETIYASPAFRKLFLKPDSFQVNIPDSNTSGNIAQSTLSLGYNLILRKFYSIQASYITTSIHPFKDPETGMTKYFELKMDGRYIDVKTKVEGFVLPEKTSSLHSLNTNELQEILAIENFVFEGIIIIDVADVTEREVISEIKNNLLGINAFSDATVYDNLQLHIQALIGLTGIKIGITPFFKMNNFYLFSEVHVNNSLLFKNQKAVKEKNWINEYCQELFKESNQPVFFEELTEKIASDEFLHFYYEQGIRSLLICPLKTDGQLIGLLELGATELKKLKILHIAKIESAIPLFTLALEKSMESLEVQINRKIKESFTAVQAAVEWKFTEAAFNYIQQKQFNENAKMPPIIFEDVYPLYGAIDIRSSSEERSRAIQLDLVEQLELAIQVVRAAKKIIQFPLLKEIEFKIEKYLTLDPEQRITEDEVLIHEFLQEEVYSIFTHLEKNTPELNEHVSVYMKALDPQRKMVYNHRKQYEETIAKINDTLENFVEYEQLAAQEVFPHYFEHYVTDGIEFNIYIGQSMAPEFKFDEIYVRNLKLWQLTLLAKSARLTHALEKKLSLPLQTTQLILSQATPISISFRSKERKFDVDGSYNMRYEIIKKRIDKVHLRDQKERLTQPGTIAIVYSQQKEKAEYYEFIEVLQNDGLLLPDIEELELEELQGVSGLNALRVKINLEFKSTTNNKPVLAPEKNLPEKVKTKQITQ
jgi:hypothetical protein